VRAPRRFISVLLIGFLVTLLSGQGLLWGLHPGLAQEPPGAVQDEPVAVPDRTLPTPGLEPPDGTLKLPPDRTTPATPERVEGTEETEETPTPTSLLDGLTPDQARRSQLLMAGDRRYQAGDTAAAVTLYRLAKESTWLVDDPETLTPGPITDPEDLPPAGRVYWREAQAGAESGVASRLRVPLELLVKDYPEFLPGQALYARYLMEQGQTQAARQRLEEAITLYPYHPDLLKAQAELQMAQEQWIEAAITANQFALLNPDHPDRDAMAQLAQQNLGRFRGAMNQSLTRNLISNIITGAAGYILTGGLLGPFTAVNSGILLMQGESGLGQQVADQARRQLPLVQDPEVRAYVNDLGQKLAALSGRDEFTYSFEVVMDDSLNAFALPGGKIFINAGALTRAHSEAELAGLLGHEIAHAVLSHGFQMVTQGNLTASLAAFIPIPEVANITANLLVASYSRDMERQADLLGTKLLATGGYAADGLHNLMITLGAEQGNRGIGWFASHPNPSDRVSYLQQLISQGGFDRYSYEGAETHLAMRQRMTQLMDDYRQEHGLEADEPLRRRP
jgi:Zn-dependent protease with chaperone function